MNLRATLCLFPLLSVVALTAEPGDLRWAFSTDDVVYSSPAVGADGTIYVGSNDTNVYAINPDGTEKWRFIDATDWFDSSPALGRNGTVYIGGWDTTLYALDGNTGELAWSYPTGGYIVSSPAVGADGTVYVASGDGLLYALDEDGTLDWTYAGEGPFESSPALAADGTIYVGDTLGTFHAINPDGTEKWTFAVDPVLARENGILSSPAIGTDGTIYFGAQNWYVYALNPEGDLSWSYELGDDIDSSPVVGADGTVYLANREGYVYAISPAGLQEWEALVGDIFYAGLAVDTQGNLYTASYLGDGWSQVVALDADGANLWSYPVEGYNDSSPVLGPDGTLYIGMHNGDLLAIEAAAALDESAPWPAFRQNLRHTGRATSYWGDPAILAQWPGTYVHYDHWYKLTGFGQGWFFSESFPYIYHLDHGWIWIAGPDDQTFWFYDASWGWVWYDTANRNIYYSYDLNTWLYDPPTPESSEIVGNRWVFDFGLGEAGDWIKYAPLP